MNSPEFVKLRFITSTIFLHPPLSPMCSLSWGLVLYGAVSGRGCSPSLRSSSWCLPRISEWEVGVDFGGRQCVAETFMQRRLREVLPVFMLEDNFSELVEVMEILGVTCY